MADCGLTFGGSEPVSPDNTVEQKPPMRFKQRTERSTEGEVTLMEWSPTMDVLALALADHSVRVEVQAL